MYVQGFSARKGSFFFNTYNAVQINTDESNTDESIWGVMDQPLGSGHSMDETRLHIILKRKKGEKKTTRPTSFQRLQFKLHW